VRESLAAAQLDGADPASPVFGFGAIPALAGRAAHLEAVRRARRQVCGKRNYKRGRNSNHKAATESKQTSRRLLKQKGINGYWLQKLVPEGLTELKREHGIKR
jgi:hypothetical protein